MVRMLSAKRCRSGSEYEGSRSISAFVRITVSGVFSSCEASETNCFCCVHALSTGFTAQRARRKLTARNTAAAHSPMRIQLRQRFCIVAFALDTSAKMIYSFPRHVVRR